MAVFSSRIVEVQAGRLTVCGIRNAERTKVRLVVRVGVQRRGRSCLERFHLSCSGCRSVSVAPRGLKPAAQGCFADQRVHQNRYTITENALSFAHDERKATLFVLECGRQGISAGVT